MAKKVAKEEVKAEKVVKTKEEVVIGADGRQVILSKRAKVMKDVLAKQKKVELFIPRSGKEPKGTRQTITLNGYPFHILKGARVEVPAQVADVYYESVASQEQALENAVSRAGNKDGV